MSSSLNEWVTTSCVQHSVSSTDSNGRGGSSITPRRPSAVLPPGGKPRSSMTPAVSREPADAVGRKVSAA
jgi:hypothetical protein